MKVEKKNYTSENQRQGFIERLEDSTREGSNLT